jgi:hypothetical protein
MSSACGRPWSGKHVCTSVGPYSGHHAGVSGKVTASIPLPLLQTRCRDWFLALNQSSVLSSVWTLYRPHNRIRKMLGSHLRRDNDNPKRFLSFPQSFRANARQCLKLSISASFRIISNFESFNAIRNLGCDSVRNKTKITRVKTLVPELVGSIQSLPEPDVEQNPETIHTNYVP